MTCPACGHTTQGDLIVARATAGAVRVEAEQAVERARLATKHAHGRARIAAARATFAAAEERLAGAKAAEQLAVAAEAQGAPERPPVLEAFERAAAAAALGRTPSESTPRLGDPIVRRRALTDHPGAAMVPVRGD